MYSTNYQLRIDKMGVILNYGQIPLVKTRYREYINQENNPYGECYCCYWCLRWI